MKAIKISIFLLLFLTIFLILQSVFKPLYSYPELESSASDKIHSIPKEPINVLFLGTSHVYSACDPNYIYEKNGIVSYNLATSAQRLSSSYYVLKNFYKKSNTEFVFFDVGSLFVKNNEKFNSNYYFQTLDELPFNIDKLRYALTYSRNDFSKKSDSLITSLCPLYHYHTRWCELTKNDFITYNNHYYFLRGYDGMSWTIPSNYTVEWIFSQNIEKYNRNNIVEKKYINGDYESEKRFEANYVEELYEENKNWLLRINQLCKQNNTQLILMKIPVLTGPAEYNNPWTKVRSDLVHQFALENDLSFLDLEYDYDLGIDVQCDYWDQGRHLNHLGAQKVSSFLADFIDEKYNFSKVYSKALEKDQKYYKKYSSLMNLAFSRTLPEYCSFLSLNANNYAILMAFFDDGLYGMNEEEKQAMKNLGLKTDFNSSSYSDAFLAVIDKGLIKYEAISNSSLKYNYQLADGTKVDLISQGFLSDRLARIQLNNVDYSLYNTGRSGLHIAVYDYDTHMIIDNVGFDFRYDENRCYRTSIDIILNRLKNYIYAVEKI